MDGKASLPLSANQATALKPRVYPLGTDHPEPAIGVSEGVDFHVGELDAPLAQGPEGFESAVTARSKAYQPPVPHDHRLV
jgi:hypothetical protein